MKIVGGAKIASPFVFYRMTIREAKLAIKGHRNEMHEAYITNLYANTNAIGSCLGGKNFKAIDPFDSKKEDKSNNKQTSAKDIAFYSAFGIDAKDISAIKNQQEQSHDNTDWDKLSVEEKRKLLFNK
jgi:hypothetical protein